jgi:hypothetical protein
MLAQEEVEILVNLRDKEKVNLELKSIRIITSGNKDAKEKLACGIVALANKNGGRLIIGVNDDGTFDGKFAGNTDDIKEYIHNICRDHISPSVHFEIQFIESENWDVFIVYIPKRRNIPHAFISKRNGHEIAERVYYTRTPNGKKLLTDIELEWMFKNQEESEYTNSFRLSLDFDKQLILVGNGKLFYEGSHHVNNFQYNLSEADKGFILNDHKNFPLFVVELFPYLILGSISIYFSDSWYIGMHEEFDRASSGALITNIPIESTSISIADVPTTGMSIINNLSWDFKKIFNDCFSGSDSFKVPLNTTISITYKNRTAKILFANPKFSIEIFIGMLTSGGGLSQKNPDYEVLRERNPSYAHTYAITNHYHFDGAGRIKANFEFAGYDIDEFKKIEHFYNSLKQCIDKIWNYDLILKNLSHKDIRVMHSKVDDILQNTIITYNAVSNKSEI